MNTYQAISDARFSFNSGTGILTVTLDTIGVTQCENFTDCGGGALGIVSITSPVTTTQTVDLSNLVLGPQPPGCNQ
jgi:hypothetical protein